MGTPLPTAPPQNFVPQLNPQIAKDWANYEASLEQYQADLKEIQRLAAALSHMKNPMFGIQEVMGAVMNMSGDQIASLSSLDNLDTDLRNLLQGAQSSYNGILGGSGSTTDPTKAQIADAQQMTNDINQLEAIVKWQQSLGDKSAFDSGTLNNLESAINSIKGACVDGYGDSIWGNASLMARQFNIANNPIGNGGGTYSPMLKAISDGFQTINQSVSALSTTTNTKLQFTTEQYKQCLGIDQSSIQSYLKLTAAMIQNEKTN